MKRNKVLCVAVGFAADAVSLRGEVLLGEYGILCGGDGESTKIPESGYATRRTKGIKVGNLFSAFISRRS